MLMRDYRIDDIGGRKVNLTEVRQLPATHGTPVPTMQMKTQFAFGKNGIEVAVPEGFEYQ